MILIQQLKLRIPHEEQQIRAKAAHALMIPEQELLSMEILRRSIDARKKPELFYSYTVEVQVKNEEKVLARAQKNPRSKEQISKSSRSVYRFPKEEPGSSGKEQPGSAGKEASGTVGKEASGCVNREERPRPVIAGAGPAGLFCAYYLALAGQKPLLLERGKCVEERQKDVERFWQTGALDPKSNVQFGEGGAGTFSDGKLNTLVKDRDGRSRAVLETFVKFGAPKEILYDAKPHIGTDVLTLVVKGLREEILRLGGIICFESQVTDLEAEDRRLTYIVINGSQKIACETLVLAIGHSARDTFFMLREKGLPMEAKPFAVGLRAEHPQSMINFSQYGSEKPGELGAAPYKVTAKAGDGRGVYSFCMCPGGYVVNASSEEGRLAVNGMSYSGRGAQNANSAIIVAVTPKDYPGEGPLAGVEFQRALEERAYQLGGGKIPMQRYGEYRSAVWERAGGKAGAQTSGQEGAQRAEQEISPCHKGASAWADLSGLLPAACSLALVEGMEAFARQIPGFNRPDTLLSGVESRTSSPVRILRDETLQSDVRGIYPCGEGAGYAGGILSAAMDGLRVAEEICRDRKDRD